MMFMYLRYLNERSFSDLLSQIAKKANLAALVYPAQIRKILHQSLPILCMKFRIYKELRLMKLLREPILRDGYRVTSVSRSAISAPDP